MTATPVSQALLKEIPVGKIAGKFYVPGYQRGYRWGADEVDHLLVDIYESQGRRYHLQPVVVKSMPDGKWELVDGQQRLTTLYLILHYIQREVLPSAEAEPGRNVSTYARRQYSPGQGRQTERVPVSHPW